MADVLPGQQIPGQQNAPLEIEFLDPIDDIEVGHVFRFHVLQPNAKGEKQLVAIEHLDFVFEPMEWGKVAPTDDPGLGEIHVSQIVEPEDVFLAPQYSVHAMHRRRAVQHLAPKRRVKMSAVALEIELGFAIGLEGKWKQFQPLSLPRPVNLETAKLSDPDRQSLIVRDGRVFLRVEALEALPCDLSLTFPNGETAGLRIDGTLKGISFEPGERSRLRSATVVNAKPQSEDGETASCRQEVVDLRTYVASFGGAGKRKPDEATADSIRRRIGARVARVKERLVNYKGSSQEELLGLFKSATDLIPSYLRELPAPEPAPVAAGEAATGVSAPEPAAPAAAPVASSGPALSDDPERTGIIEPIDPGPSS